MQFSIDADTVKGKSVEEHCSKRGIPCVMQPDGSAVVHCGDEKILAELTSGKLDEDSFLESEARTAKKKEAKAKAVALSELKAKAAAHIAKSIADATDKAQKEAAEMLAGTDKKKTKKVKASKR